MNDIMKYLLIGAGFVFAFTALICEVYVLSVVLDILKVIAGG